MKINKKIIYRAIITFILLLFFILFVILFWIYIQLGIFKELIYTIPEFILSPKKQYLVLLQNNYELRPTGGFISAYAKVEFTFGIPTQIKIGDSYEIDHTDPQIMSGKEIQIIQAPKKIEELLNHKSFKGWVFRDSNFDPDFTISAQKVIDFYNIIYPDEQIDGVIAINFSFFEDFLNLIGPINIDNYLVDKNNFFNIIQFESKNIDLHNVDSIKNRKKFINNFFKIGIKLANISLDNINTFTNFFEKQLSKKNIQLYIQNKNSALYNFVSKYNYNNNINKNSNTNYLAIIGANYGGRKSDRYLTRNINRYINHIFEDKYIENKIDFELIHNGDKAYLSHIYIGYYRFLIPKKAYDIKIGKNEQIDIYNQVINSTNIKNSVDIEDYNDNFKSIGFTIQLEPHNKYNISINYKLPFDINFLNVFYNKQPGINNESYNLYIHTPLELHITSDKLYTAENTAVFKNIVDKDILLNYDLKINNMPLMIIYQDFDIDTKRIEIRYDRTIEKNSAIDITNYNITDKNINVPNINNENIKISKIEYHEDFVYIWVDNVDKQIEEHFNINIKNQQDRLGNKTQPEVRNITVVMRKSDK